jgi:hypothetical protein
VKRVFPFFLFAVCIIRGIGAIVIPSELVGAWAPADSKMQGGVLLEGFALYINTNGLAAIAAAPPATGTPWHASYNTTNQILTLTLILLPGESLTDEKTNCFVYDSSAKTLSLTNASATEAWTLTRHSNRVPGGTFEGVK